MSSYRTNLNEYIMVRFAALCKTERSPTVAQAFGSVIDHQLGNDPTEIMEVAAWAMECSGRCHDVCEQLWMLAGKVAYQQRRL